MGLIPLNATLLVATFVSLNAQFIFVTSMLIFYCSQFARKSASGFVLYSIVLMVAYPASAVGQTGILKPSVYIIFVALLFLIYSVFSRYKYSVRISRAMKILIMILLLGSLFIYLPIFLETYLSIDVTGPEEEYVSNERRSHMLSFVFPFVLSPLVSFAVIRSMTIETDFKIIFQSVAVITFLLIVLSFVKYGVNLDFIPQEYGDVRKDGFRLNGFTNPDTNGFARSLLWPLALIFSYMLLQKSNKKNILLFVFMTMAIAMTFSRTAYVSSFVIIAVISLYSFTFNNFVRMLAYVAIALVFAYYVGVFDSMMSRNEAGIHLSGRSTIYLAALEAIHASPLVGLRPGGWVEYLYQGVSYLGTSLRVQSAHSFYISTALHWGLPILILFLVIVFYSMVLLHRANKVFTVNGMRNTHDLRTWSVAMIALTVGLLVHGIVEIVPYYYFTFIVGIAWGFNSIAKDLELEQKYTCFNNVVRT